MNDPATFERCLAYVETQFGPDHPRPHSPSPRAFTVTLSRQTGTGGIAIAGRLAAFLQERLPSPRVPWTVFHRSLVERVLAEHNLPAYFGRYMPEDRVSYIRDTVEELLGLHPSRTDLVTRTTETMLGLAELGNCILVGRAAHIILAGSPSVIHVRLIGSTGRRIARIMQDRNLPEARAARFIHDEDAARSRYLKAHFNSDVDDPLAYDITLNTDRHTLDEAAHIIGLAVLERANTASSSPPPRRGDAPAPVRSDAGRT